MKDDEAQKVIADLIPKLAADARAMLERIAVDGVVPFKFGDAEILVSVDDFEALTRDEVLYGSAYARAVPGRENVYERLDPRQVRTV